MPVLASSQELLLEKKDKEFPSLLLVWSTEKERTQTKAFFGTRIEGFYLI
jgi:hypothetical protein